jgi:hypothetical protein
MTAPDPLAQRAEALAKQMAKEKFGAGFLWQLCYREAYEKILREVHGDE